MHKYMGIDLSLRQAKNKWKYFLHSENIIDHQPKFTSFHEATAKFPFQHAFDHASIEF